MSEETDSREGVEDMLKEEKELTKVEVPKLDMGAMLYDEHRKKTS